MNKQITAVFCSFVLGMSVANAINIKSERSNAFPILQEPLLLAASCQSDCHAMATECKRSCMAIEAGQERSRCIQRCETEKNVCTHSCR